MNQQDSLPTGLPAPSKAVSGLKTTMQRRHPASETGSGDSAEPPLQAPPPAGIETRPHDASSPIPSGYSGRARATADMETEHPADLSDDLGEDIKESTSELGDGEEHSHLNARRPGLLKDYFRPVPGQRMSAAKNDG